MDYYDIKITDTFGGEANYCWVKRYVLALPEATKLRVIMRKAKALAGWTGLRCATHNYGVMISVRPRRICNVMFITWRDTGIHPITDETEVHS